MELNEDFEDLEGLPKIRNMPEERLYNHWRVNRKLDKKLSQSEIAKSLEEQSDEAGDYSFSYDASRHERSWIMNSLGIFFEMQWFEDILRIVKGGKEASVYQCLSSSNSPVEGKFLAAKVYRPRRFRNLRNDYVYREGRDELDELGNVITKEGKLRAIRQRTNYGRQIMHTSWIEHEYKTLQLLYEAGADVPNPFTRGNNAILMQFVGSIDMAAPTLNTIDLDLGEAKLLFERVLHNVELMLANERVHGDLSAYNILYWKGNITMIDFPQAISPYENPNAFHIFHRDMMRISEYFIRQGVVIDYHALAKKLWQAHKYREMPKIDLSLLNLDDENDRSYWEDLRLDK